MKKKFAAMAATLLALCFAVFPACDKGGEPNATGSVTGVKFTCDEIMFSGETVTLKATVETEGTVADKSVTWSVAGDDAEISAEGKLTLLQPGEITVTAAAKADPTKSASRKVEILQGGAPINGTFDRTGDLMWGIYPDNPDGYEKTAELKRDGKYSLKVTATEEYTILFHSVTIGGGNNEMKAGGFYVIEGYALSQAENGGTVKTRVNFQNVISASEKPTLGAVDATQLTEADTWTRVASSTVRVPDDATAFNACIELYGKGEIFLDSIRVVEVESNDTRLAELKVDGVAVEGYNDDINAYTVQVEDVTAAVVTAVPVSSTTEASVTAGEGFSKVLVTAEDGTEREITITFVEKQAAGLSAISVGGVPIAEFSTLRTEYYKLLSAGTTEIPEITYTKTDAAASATLESPASLPGYAVIKVSNEGENKEYRIYFEVASENMLTMEYWNTGFESGTSGWGTDGAEVSAEYSHGGLYSLKAGANGKGGWLGFDLAGGNVAPAKGDSVKIGVWAYIVPAETVSGHILIEFREKENDVLAATVQREVTEADAGKWIYVETPASSAITEAAGYGQAVVKNFTDSTVYFDDVRVLRSESAPPVTPEENELDLSAFDPSFEGTEKKFESWAVDPAFDKNVFHGGAQSVKLEAPANAGFKFTLTVGDEVQVGEKLRFTAWLYVENAESENGAMLKIETLSGETSTYRTHKFAGAERGEWVQLSIEYTVQAGDEKVFLVVANEAAATYYVDDVQVFVQK